MWGTETLVFLFVIPEGNLLLDNRHTSYIANCPTQANPFGFAQGGLEWAANQQMSPS